jgi:hypothetical protein
MEERIASSRAPRPAPEHRAAIDELLAEIRRMNEHMDRNREEIERLKARSEASRARTEVIGARIDARLEAIEALL